MEPLIDAKQTAKLLGVSESWVRDAVARQKIPHLKLRPGKGAVRFRESELEQWAGERLVPERGFFIDKRGRRTIG